MILSGSDNLDLSALVENLQTDQVIAALKKKIYARIAHSQIPDPEFRNRLRKIRPIEPNLFLLCVERKSEAGLQ
jgi:hypothetical protein